MNVKRFCSFVVVFGFLLSASAEYAEIAIDGDFSDWRSIPSITNDPLDHVEGGVDFKEMWVANDNDYLYIRYTFHAPANPIIWNVRTYINGDNNPNTGHNPANQSLFGSEIVVENISAYQESGDNWNETGPDGLPNASVQRAVAPSGVVTQLECRISRFVVGSNAPYAGVLLMSSDTIRILLQDDRNPNYDYMPDTQGVAYTFAPQPPPPSYYKKITIDGSFSDWAGVPSVVALPTNSVGDLDWKEMWIANDEEYLYVKYTLHEDADPHTGRTIFFVDSDNNKTSGYQVRGAFGTEFMVHGDGNVYQQAGGDWNEGALTSTGLQHAPKGIAKEFEFRVARTLTGGFGAFIAQPLFTSGMIRIIAYNEFNSKSTAMPNYSGAPYVFAPTPPPGGTILQVQ